MPCTTLKDNTGRPVGIVCSRGRRSPCRYCGRSSSRLCDFPVLRDGVRGTCDAALCDRCTTKIAGDGDLCRAHAPLFSKELGRPLVGPGTADETKGEG